MFLFSGNSGLEICCHGNGPVIPVHIHNCLCVRNSQYISIRSFFIWSPVTFVTWRNWFRLCNVLTNIHIIKVVMIYFNLNTNSWITINFGGFGWFPLLRAYYKLPTINFKDTFNHEPISTKLILMVVNYGSNYLSTFL